MREILFRGQTRRKGEKVRLDGTPVDGNWVYGGVAQFNEERAIIYQTEPEFHKFSVYADTVGQYTGLTDKNGVRIFEGDILQSRYTGEYSDDVAIEVVKWIYNGWHTQQRDYAPDVIDDVGIMPYSEVIGNVHDNRLEAFYGR